MTLRPAARPNYVGYRYSSVLRPAEGTAGALQRGPSGFPRSRAVCYIGHRYSARSPAGRRRGRCCFAQEPWFATTGLRKWIARRPGSAWQKTRANWFSRPAVPPQPFNRYLALRYSALRGTGLAACATWVSSGWEEVRLRPIGAGGGLCGRCRTESRPRAAVDVCTTL